MKLPKIFLAISLLTFLFSLTAVGSSVAYGVLKPLGAVFFILFFISQLLEKEAAMFDREYSEQMELAKQHRALAPVSNRVEDSPAPVSGHRGFSVSAH